MVVLWTFIKKILQKLFCDTHRKKVENKLLLICRRRLQDFSWNFEAAVYTGGSGSGSVEMRAGLGGIDIRPLPPRFRRLLHAEG